jgi:hypothetical protein
VACRSQKSLGRGQRRSAWGHAGARSLIVQGAPGGQV